MLSSSNNFIDDKNNSAALDNTNTSANADTYFMSLAVAQAKHGMFTTRPNPAVGCVLVANNQVIAQGYHAKAGQAHAEINALAQAGSAANGATAYVTLEPCSHHGKTPPCAQALIDAKLARVVVAGLDPNPKVAGQGVMRLQQAGIEVTVGVGDAAAAALNVGFLTAMREGRPYVRLKLATSLDGRIAMASGESQWITGDAAREDGQRLRALSGAIITGSQTIIDDNPRLNVRTHSLGVPIDSIPQPKVVVLDRRGRLQTQTDSPYTVCQRTNTLLWQQNDLAALLRVLVDQYQVYEVLVEAGASVASGFLQQHLVDELIVYQAPCLLGMGAKPMTRLSFTQLAEQYRFRLCGHQQLGEDLRLCLQPY